MQVNRAPTISVRRKATASSQQNPNRVFALLHQQMNTKLRSKIQKRLKDQGETEAWKLQYIAMTQLLEREIVSGAKQAAVQAHDLIQKS